VSRCLRNRSSSENPARGVRTIRFLGSDYVTARSRSSSRQRHLLLLDSDMNCTATTFLHRLRSTTSSNALWRLVRMEPPMPSAWDPLLGTSYSHLFVNSQCLCAMLSLLHSMSWIYMILVLTSMFRLSCLYIFYHDFGSYMIYNLTIIFVLFYLGIYEHVNYPFLFM
jgi:hypothetical protein